MIAVTLQNSVLTVHCAENGGYCDIHTSPNSELKESEQESGDNPVPTLNEKYNENKERVWIL